jgi:very-short-patch-repair endonuclease
VKVTRNQFVTREKLQLARDLRRRMTPQEKILWHALRNDALSLHFRRQQVIAGYIVDFHCASAELAVEIDGGSHLDRAEHDSLRDRVLAEMGITTLRISNQAVHEDLNGVLLRIAVQADSPSPEGRAGKGVR